MGIVMGKSTLEERGRIIIPQEIRNDLNLKPGQEIIFEKRDDGVFLRPSTDLKQFSAGLKGCVKRSKIKPNEIKTIWNM